MTDWLTRRQVPSTDAIHFSCAWVGIVLIRETILSDVNVNVNVKMYIAQFHAKHLNCARCTSISRTRSSSMCAERHRRSQPVHAVRQAVYQDDRTPDREGPPTESATSIPRNDQAVQVDRLVGTHISLTAVSTGEHETLTACNFSYSYRSDGAYGPNNA